VIVSVPGSRDDGAMGAMPCLNPDSGMNACDVSGNETHDTGRVLSLMNQWNGLSNLPWLCVHQLFPKESELKLEEGT
jgi:hypothetical protein